MSRIESCLRELSAANRKAVVPYIVAGDPSAEVTVPLMHALVEAGADMIELGVPFSDPMAEGPVIQLAHERALANQVSLTAVLQMVKEFRERNSSTPVVLMGYANPIEAMGYRAFTEQAAEAQIDGMLTVDMPPEEFGQLNELLAARGLDNILLISPTTSAERIETICRQASGYIYYVSLKGVTGAGHLDTADVESKVNAIKAKTELPVCVGFGIKDADSARKIAACADGIVIGSVLVNRLAEFVQQTDASVDELCNIAKLLVTDIVAGANS